MYAKRTFCYIIRKTSDTHVRVFARSQDHILPCLHAPMITCAHNSHTLHTCFDAIQRIHYRTITRANTQRSIATHCTYIHIQTMHAHIHTRTHTHTGTLEDPYLWQLQSRRHLDAVQSGWSTQTWGYTASKSDGWSPTGARVCMRVCMCVCMYVLHLNLTVDSQQVRLYSCVHVCTYVCMHTCMCVCMSCISLWWWQSNVCICV